MTQPRPPKKSETLEIRMPYEAKEAFMARCRDDGRYGLDPDGIVATRRKKRNEYRGQRNRQTEPDQPGVPKGRPGPVFCVCGCQEAA